MDEAEKQEIRSRVDIAELVGRSVALTRAGATFKGLCPFHDDKRPSMIVTPARGTYHCFSCGAHGDIFEWVRQRESLTFPEAVRALADIAGVQLRATDPSRDALRARCFDVLEAAVAHCRAQLRSAPPAVMSYLSERGLLPETIEAFEIGYEPVRPSIAEALRSRGFGDADLVNAGIYGQRDGRTWDAMRERIVFPVRSESGKVVTLAGRVIPGREQAAVSPDAKYVNGYASEIFQKGSVLYGLHAARRGDRLARSRTAVIVEGYLDVIACHQSGFTNVLGAMSARVNALHVPKLRRFADTIILALDADAAGAKGAQDSSVQIRDTLIGLLGAESDSGVSIKIFELPAGKDPDEVVLAEPAVWETGVAAALPVIQWVLLRHGRSGLATVEAKRAAAAEVIPYLRAVREPIARHEFRGRVKHALGIDDVTLDRLLERAAGTAPAPHAAPAEPSRPVPVRTLPPLAELRAFHALLVYPQSVAELVGARAVPLLGTGDFVDGGVLEAFTEATAYGKALPTLDAALAALGKRHEEILTATYATPLPEGTRSLGQLLLDVRRVALRRQRDAAALACDEAALAGDEGAADAADAEVRSLKERLAAVGEGIRHLSERQDSALTD